MTPAKRRRLTRIIFALGVILLAGIASRVLFHGEKLPSIILGRKPGSADPGTVLTSLIPEPKTSQAAPIVKASMELPPEAKNPIKIKIKTLGNWQYGKDSIPEQVRKLDGKWIEISGFMWSNNETQYLDRYILIQSLWGCCFGKAPDMNHFIDVSMEPGKITAFYPDPVKIIGKFSVGEEKDNEGNVLSIYRIQASMVTVK